MTHDTSTPAAQAARQLTDELAAAAARWAPIVGPDAGLDLDRQARQRARMLAAQLTGDDDRLAGETVTDVLGVLWGHADPPHDWWRTPLGRVCARSLGHETADAVTHAVAAAMLGIPRGTVSTLLTRGKLDRHPDGGVTIGSVYARLWDLV